MFPKKDKQTSKTHGNEHGRNLHPILNFILMVDYKLKHHFYFNSKVQIV